MKKSILGRRESDHCYRWSNKERTPVIIGFCNSEVIDSLTRTIFMDCYGKKHDWVNVKEGD